MPERRRSFVSMGVSAPTRATTPRRAVAVHARGARDVDCAPMAPTRRPTRRNWRRILIRTGATLWVAGMLPLSIYELLAKLTGDPTYSDNPVGLGLLGVAISGPGFLLALIGFCLDAPRAGGTL